MTAKEFTKKHPLATKAEIDEFYPEEWYVIMKDYLEAYKSDVEIPTDEEAIKEAIIHSMGYPDNSDSNRSMDAKESFLIGFKYGTNR